MDCPTRIYSYSLAGNKDFSLLLDNYTKTKNKSPIQECTRDVIFILLTSNIKKFIFWKLYIFVVTLYIIIPTHTIQIFKDIFVFIVWNKIKYPSK